MERVQSAADIPLTRVKWERSTENAPDLHPALNATIAALAVFVIVITATAMQNATGWRWGVLFAVCAAAVAFLIVFCLLLVRMSQLGLREWTVETPVIPADDGRVRLMVPADDNPRGILAAGYTFSEGDVTRLAAALYRSGWMFTRDTVRGSRAFARAEYGDWNQVLERFQRAELVDDRRRVTPKGIELFKQYLPAPRNFQPSENAAARPRPPYVTGEVAGHNGVGGVA